MLHRLAAALGYPAHVLNRELAGPLGRIGLPRVPGALVVGLGLAAMAVSTAAGTLQAYDARPEPRPSTIEEIARGRVVSGLWVELDAEVLEGPHRATIEISAGGGQSELAERTYYLVVDPAAPGFGMVVRVRDAVSSLDATGGPVHIDGTITEDTFNMRSLLEAWAVGERHPGLAFSQSRLIAYAFATPWREPSWIPAALLGLLAAVIGLGALIRQPILRTTRTVPGERGRTPIALRIHGDLDTARGPVHVGGTAAQLTWMSVEEVARIRWRYWGAALGDVRRSVEDAVRAHGSAGEQLVVYGPSGSVIWPIEDSAALKLQAGDAFLGLRRLPAVRVTGGGANVTLTFSDAAARDAAVGELRPPEEGGG
jgi:hypothetical protein